MRCGPLARSIFAFEDEDEDEDEDGTIRLCACRGAVARQGRVPTRFQLRRYLADGTEAGIISCRDGSSSRFWFRSHHLTHDDGGTLFRFSDGIDLFMSGWFCCEVQLPEQQLASLVELRAFIREHDGISP